METCTEKYRRKINSWTLWIQYRWKFCWNCDESGT